MEGEVPERRCLLNASRIPVADLCMWNLDELLFATGPPRARKSRTLSGFGWPVGVIGPLTPDLGVRLKHLIPRQSLGPTWGTC